MTDQVIKNNPIQNKCVEGLLCFLHENGEKRYLRQKDAPETIVFETKKWYYQGTSDGRAFYTQNPNGLPDKKDK